MFSGGVISECGIMRCKSVESCRWLQNDSEETAPSILNTDANFLFITIGLTLSKNVRVSFTYVDHKTVAEVLNFQVNQLTHC